MTAATQLQLLCVKADRALVAMLATAWRRVEGRARGEVLPDGSEAEDRANLLFLLKVTARCGTLDRVDLPPDLARLLVALQPGATP